MIRPRPLLLALVMAVTAGSSVADAPSSKAPHPQPVVTPAPAPDTAALAAAKAKMERLDQATRLRPLTPYPVPRAPAPVKPVTRPAPNTHPFDLADLTPSQREKLARGQAELRARTRGKPEDAEGRRAP